MDDKIRSVLENEELLAKIAAAVRGAEAPKEAYPAPAKEPFPAPPAQGGGSDALALLYALRPFLRRERQEKLEAVTKAISVANVYKNVKKL